jgi:hypothetical protein
MITALALALVLGAGPADTLSPVALQGLTFKAPTGWTREAPDDNTLEWTAPGEVGKVAVSAFPFEKPIPPAACMKKMLEAVGKDGFETFSLDAAPAAKKVTSDYVGQGEGAKSDANRVTTTTVLGCNGKVKWLITLTIKTSEAVRLGPISKRIIDSVAYGK